MNRTAATSPPRSGADAPSIDLDQLSKDFASRGLVILPPSTLGVPDEIHARIYADEHAVFSAKKPVTTTGIPDVLEILRAPGLIEACDQLVGPNWAVVPFTHCAPFVSGTHDQHWHKDDNGPFNSRKHRHHQPVQIEMLYYPQEVRADMGPTATIPYSQYWTFNHEENHDNFAGADHLDFNYQIDGMERRPVSGPNSAYDADDIAGQRTAHDIRMRDAVTNTGWPLLRQFEAGPLQAGSVILYSHNLFHRGNHRRDAFSDWRENPRFMWRFWLYRTTQPDPRDCDTEFDWTAQGLDELTGIDRTNAPDDATIVWRAQHHFLQTGTNPPATPDAAALGDAARRRLADDLQVQLKETGDIAEPRRIGAAYKLAAIGDPELATSHLGNALFSHRESVRRAATFGLAAVGPAATPTFLSAIESPLKWVRKAGAFGLGEVAQLNSQVLDALRRRLEDEPSVYVRSVAAGSIGCLARRAVAGGDADDLIPDCASVLIDCLGREVNRLSMDQAQDRSIKFVRPTDESDVCEGIGIDYSVPRFNPVRSAVRENALWSLVIICSHGAHRLGTTLEPLIACLIDIAEQDDNVFNVGFALDALTRLAHIDPRDADSDNDADADADARIIELNSNLRARLLALPIRSWESLVASGLTREYADAVEAAARHTSAPGN
jgi:hypothetical protein